MPCDGSLNASDAANPILGQATYPWGEETPPLHSIQSSLIAATPSRTGAHTNSTTIKAAKQVPAPVGMLGGKTPRACARTKAGREKVAGWLKLLESQGSRRGRDAGDLMGSYDFGWMWTELGIADLRRGRHATSCAVARTVCSAVVHGPRPGHVPAFHGGKNGSELGRAWPA